MAVGARLRDSLGLEVQSIWSDDGIAFHLPDADAPPPTEELLIDPDELEDLVVAGGGADRALRRALPRERRARAADPAPPARRAHAALAAAAEGAVAAPGRAPLSGSFPIVLETYRECLQDVFDLPALKRLLQGLQTRQIDLVDVETPSASPYSASLLFDYVATYMYEDDTPPAERRAQALSLDRDLLRELLGQEELRDLIDPGALSRTSRRSCVGIRAHRTNCTMCYACEGDLRRDEYDYRTSQRARTPSGGPCSSGSPARSG